MPRQRFLFVIANATNAYVFGPYKTEQEWRHACKSIWDDLQRRSGMWNDLVVPMILDDTTTIYHPFPDGEIGKIDTQYRVSARPHPTDLKTFNW